MRALLVLLALPLGVPAVLAETCPEPSPGELVVQCARVGQTEGTVYYEVGVDVGDGTVVHVASTGFVAKDGSAEQTCTNAYLPGENVGFVLMTAGFDSDGDGIPEHDGATVGPFTGPPPC